MVNEILKKINHLGEITQIRVNTDLNKLYIYMKDRNPRFINSNGEYEQYRSKDDPRRFFMLIYDIPAKKFMNLNKYKNRQVTSSVIQKQSNHNKKMLNQFASYLK